jgi:hypothetical protein
MGDTTFPLPQLASDALVKLEAAGLPVGPTTVTAQYCKAVTRMSALSEAAMSPAMSDLDADSLAHAMDLVAEAPRALAKWAERQQNAEAAR